MSDKPAHVHPTGRYVQSSAGPQAIHMLLAASSVLWLPVPCFQGRAQTSLIRHG